MPMIELRKSVKVQEYRLIVKRMRVQEEMPALLALVRGAYEAGQAYDNRFRQRHVLEEWQEKLLPTFNDAMLRRLFENLKESGYIEPVPGSDLYQLTPLAERAVQENTFWRSEAGIYRVFVWESDKELRQKLGFTRNVELVLAIPQPGAAKENLPQRKQASAQDFLGELHYIDDNRSNNNTPTLVKAIIEELESPIFVVGAIDATLTVHSDNPHAVFLRLHVRKDFQPEVQLELPAGETLWDSTLPLEKVLLKRAYGDDYDPTTHALRLPFSEDNLDFEAEHVVKSPTLREVQFDGEIELTVRRLPRTEADAQAWTLARLWRDLRDYVHSEKEWMQKAREHAEPIFSVFPELTLPAPAEVARRWREKKELRRSYFYLQTPIDVRL